MGRRQAGGRKGRDGSGFYHRFYLNILPAWATDPHLFDSAHSVVGTDPKRPIEDIWVLHKVREHKLVLKNLILVSVIATSVLQ